MHAVAGRGYAGNLAVINHVGADITLAEMIPGDHIELRLVELRAAL